MQRESHHQRAERTRAESISQTHHTETSRKIIGDLIPRDYPENTAESTAKSTAQYCTTYLTKPLRWNMAVRITKDYAQRRVQVIAWRASQKASENASEHSPEHRRDHCAGHYRASPSSAEYDEGLRESIPKSTGRVQISHSREVPLLSFGSSMLTMRNQSVTTDQNRYTSKA
jgi:hypothetical protein